MAGEVREAEAGAGHGCSSKETALLHEGRGRVLLQHLGAIAAANSGFVVGLGLGWSSAALAVQQDSAMGFDVTRDEWSWVTSLFGAGAVVGSLSVGKVVHSLGRKVVLLAFGPVTLLAWALHLWASQVWMLYIGRLLIGAACGSACVACPIYVCEMAQPSIRGALSTYFEILLCLGILFVYILGKFVTVSWVNAVCLAFSVVHVACFAWFPDTPRWYLLRGRDKDARRAMLFFRGPKYDVDAELQLISGGIKENASGVSGLKAFAAPVARKALIITIILMSMQQITGVNAITFYASQLFKEAGAFDAYTASIVVAAVEVLAAIVSMFFVDRLGRRALLLLSGGSVGVCTALMGCYFFFKEYLHEDVSSISWLPIIIVSVYMFMFSIGLGPVIWVVLGEIFPDNVKGVATGIASATGWFWSFLVTKFYPGLALSLGNYTCYWIFFVMSVLSCLYIIFGLPETRGKTLDEIQAEM